MKEGGDFENKNFNLDYLIDHDDDDDPTPPPYSLSMESNMKCKP